MTTSRCDTCGSALIRSDGTPSHDIDVKATTDALIDLVESGRVRELRGDVPLADMLDLLTSDMKYTIVTYLECLDCRRTIFWGLCTRGAPIFTYVDPTKVDAHRWDKVPPRERWAGSR